LGNKDGYNTLRITNIIYSFAVFIALLKLGNIKSIQQKLKPRQTTFGIYLVHIIIIEKLLPLIFRPLKLDLHAFNVYQNSGLLLLRFAMAYLLSFALVSAISKTKAKWTIGQ